MAKNNPLKLIVDTNLWISFIISKKQSLLDPFFLTKKQDFCSALNSSQKFKKQ